MAPKSNLGKLAALLSTALVLLSMGVRQIAFAPAGTSNHSTKTLPAVPVQFRDPKDLAVGKLLVASQSLDDPNFARTVILLVHIDDQEVVGLILNRRTNLTLSRVLEDLPGAKDSSDLVYLGGPVEVPSVTALLQSSKKIEGADHIFDGVYLISTKTLLEKTLASRPDPQVFHAYLGYAGWTNNQLRKEIDLGAWFILPADTEAVFSSDPGSLWPQMIQKTVQRIAGNAVLFEDLETRRGKGVVKQRCSIRTANREPQCQR
jgi:putative transcriptional regulator